MIRRAKVIAVIIAVLMVASMAKVTAISSFTELPSDHWIYDELIKLVDAGLIVEYDGGKALRTRPPLSRYEVALILGRTHERLENQAMELVQRNLSGTKDKDWTSEDLTGVFRIMDRPLWERIFISMLTRGGHPDFAVETAQKVAELRHLADEAASALQALTGELDEEMYALGLLATSMNSVGRMNTNPRILGKLGFSQVVTSFSTSFMSKPQPTFLSTGARVERVELSAQSLNNAIAKGLLD